MNLALRKLAVFYIKFRPFDYRKDSERLYEYMMKEENQILFSHSFQCHNLPMFQEWITAKFSNNTYHDFFIIENSRHIPVGFTFSYEFFENDSHCKYTLCLYEEYQKKGIGSAAGIKMMDYLFKKYPLKRIFISVFDYNFQSLSCNLKGGFEEVGLLPEYRFWNGELFSLHILTISREKFYEIHSKTIKRLN